MAIAFPTGDLLRAAGREPGRMFTGERVELLIGRALAIAAVVFGVQAFVFAMSTRPFSSLVVVWTYRVVVFAAVAAIIATGALGRGVRVACTVFAVVYVVALAAWPVLTGYAFAGRESEPWPWYLLTVATGSLAVAYRPLVSVVFTVLVPVLYGFSASFTGSGFIGLQRTSFNVAYGILLGLVVVVLLISFRAAARNVDLARIAALDRYDHAMRAHAVEAERVEVDALVHDSVLAALQAAERANSPETEEAASRMARSALDQLRASGVGPEPGDTAVTIRELGSRLGIAARMLDGPFEVTADAEAGQAVPESIANAIGLASVQAMVNSVQHAGAPERPVTRSVALSAVDGGVRVVIADDGVGFDTTSVAPERLGLRVSIRERMAAVAGTATVESSPGHGTRVVLSWTPGTADA